MQQTHLSNFSNSAFSYADNIDVQKIATSRIVKLINEYVSESELIIDIGCGNGALKQSLPNHNIIGIDGAFNMCAIAHPLHPTICADATALPFSNNTIDNISSSLCLQWVNPLAPAIAEIARVLQNNGHAIIAILTKGTMCELEHIYHKLSIPSRLLPYLTDIEIISSITQHNLNIKHHHFEKHIIYHQSAFDFFKQLKAIGAHQTSHPTLSLQQLKSVINLYEEYFMQKQGLPVTYMVSYLVAQKL
jgi:malonyl-CoA O-methyltransferase